MHRKYPYLRILVELESTITSLCSQRKTILVFDICYECSQSVYRIETISQSTMFIQFTDPSKRDNAHNSGRIPALHETGRDKKHSDGHLPTDTSSQTLLIL